MKLLAADEFGFDGDIDFVGDEGGATAHVPSAAQSLRVEGHRIAVLAGAQGPGLGIALDEGLLGLQGAHLPIDGVELVLEGLDVLFERGVRRRRCDVGRAGIDTGNGPGEYVNSKGAVGKFVLNLAAAGIDPKMVDAVIISHFHGDHVNGLLTADNQPAFPNAEVLVPTTEWKFWSDDGEMSRAPAGRMADLFKNNRRVFDAGLKKKVTPYDWNKEVVPGITAVATVGHTPGHTSYVLSSGSDKVYLQSDVTNHPDLFVRNPGWHGFFDQDPKQAETTRRAVYDMVVAEKLMVQGFHYPFPGLGHVEKDGANYRLIPAPWNPIL